MQVLQTSMQCETMLKYQICPNQMLSCCLNQFCKQFLAFAEDRGGSNVTSRIADMLILSCTKNVKN